jgi:hypothetical protein
LDVGGEDEAFGANEIFGYAHKDRKTVVKVMVPDSIN